MPTTSPVPTVRLSLHACTLQDAPFFLDLLNRPEWLENIGDRQVYNLTAAKHYLKDKVLPDYATPGIGNWLVRRKTDGVPLGCAGVYTRPGLATPDLGFAFLAEHHGQGYAREAAASVMAHAVTHGLLELAAITLPTNRPSIRLLERLGFRRERLFSMKGDDEELLLLKWQHTDQGADAGEV